MSSNPQLEELDRIIGSLQRAVSKERISTDLEDESDPSNAFAGTYDNIIYDEFVPPPGKPPPPPPPAADVSATAIFDSAPPPPIPLSKQRSFDNLKDYETGKRGQSSSARLKVATGGIKKSTSAMALSPPHDVLEPPEPPRRKGINNIIDGPEEIDFGEDTENEKKEEENRRKKLARMSHMIKFDKVTVDDFEDIDTLLSDLESVYNKNKTPTGPIGKTAKNDWKGPAEAESVMQSGLTRVVDNIDSAVKSIGKMDKKVFAKDEKVRTAMLRINEANIKKITTRIYIEHSKMFKTIILTSIMNAEYVIKDLRRRCLLQDTSKWSLFEVINDIGIERPLRNFEIVTDVIKTWNVQTVNALLLKQYKYQDSLTVDGLKDVYPRMCGWLFLEVKKGRWQKRFFELKAKGVYYSKDSKGTNETLLCTLSTHDVYTLTKARNKAPTKFCFALKSSSIPRGLENADSTVQFLCVDHVDKMKDWVLSIRSAKSHLILADHPEYAKNARVTSTEGSPPAPALRKIRRHQEGKQREWAADEDTAPLIHKVETKQGKLPERSDAHVNRTAFGDGKGKPLVPFTAREIQNVPGVNVHRYNTPAKKEEQPAHKRVPPCRVCGCTDFAPNPFRKNSCANCFHVH